MAIEIGTGEFQLIQAKSVIIATGGAGRVFRENTNGGIVTGDGMALAFRHGVPLRDMEFVQYHPTCMPGTGLLFTEACRGEGGFLLNKDGYRYLQDYGLGPAEPTPRNKAMELGPRDRLSQAYWHEKQNGRTITTPHGEAVHLDLRHLGEAKLRERLPQIYELAVEYLGVDPARQPIPVLPAVHYTMGGILANGRTAAPLAGLFSAGECSSVGIHGANRLGSNSLTELLVFGKIAGLEALAFAKEVGPSAPSALRAQAHEVEVKALSLLQRPARSGERVATLRKEMARARRKAVASTAAPTSCKPPAPSWLNCVSATTTCNSMTCHEGGIPSGCWPWSWASSWRWPRPWRTPRWDAGNRAARINVWTVLRRATMPTS